ncbi:uncharacterized protein LOC144450246 [Glandiceps talaboti]
MESVCNLDAGYSVFQKCQELMDELGCSVFVIISEDGVSSKYMGSEHFVREFQTTGLKVKPQDILVRDVIATEKYYIGHDVHRRKISQENIVHFKRPTSECSPTFREATRIKVEMNKDTWESDEDTTTVAMETISTACDAVTFQSDSVATETERSTDVTQEFLRSDEEGIDVVMETNSDNGTTVVITPRAETEYFNSSRFSECKKVKAEICDQYIETFYHEPDVENDIESKLQVEANPGVEKVNPGFGKVNPGVEKGNPGAKTVKPQVERHYPGVEMVSPGVQKVKPGVKKVNSDIEEKTTFNDQSGDIRYENEIQHKSNKKRQRITGGKKSKDKVDKQIQKGQRLCTTNSSSLKSNGEGQGSGSTNSSSAKSNKTYKTRLLISIKMEPDDDLEKFKERLRNAMMEDNSDKSHFCEKCGWGFKDKYWLDFHNLRGVCQTQTCKYCQKTFLYKEWREHLIRDHITEMSISKCRICGKEYWTRNALHRKHAPVHNDVCKFEMSFKCEICGLEFTRPESLPRHMINSHGDKKFECSVCGRKYSVERMYKKHLLTHNVGIFQCKTCGKEYQKERALLAHIKTYHIDGCHHTCEFCGKTYSLKSSLETHRVVHSSNPTLYPCEVCGKVFMTRSVLKAHVRNMHNANKQLVQCEICGKNVRNTGILKRHQLSHDPVKTISCELCPKMFSCKDYLKRHMRTHSDQKPYQCEVCGYQCKYRENMNKHMRVHQK